MENKQAPSQRTKLKRAPHRGSYDIEQAYAIIDEAWVCHVGFVAENPDNGKSSPFVVPMNCWRIGNRLMVHVGFKSRLAKMLATGAEACVTVTLSDALVYGRTGFSHSFNYRSLMVFGTPEPIEDKQEKTRALDVLVNKMDVNTIRAAQLRPMTDGEMKATAVFAFEINEFSIKIRDAGVNDKKSEKDNTSVWAGVIPLTTTAGHPLADEGVGSNVPVPKPAGVANS